MTDTDRPFTGSLIPIPTPDAASDHEQQLARFKHLTEVALPEAAREHQWPIRLDHCFKRICLDAAFHDVWYNHLRKPAERHISGEPLARALACAEAILAEGRPTLDLHNAESLRFRGKSHPIGSNRQPRSRS